MSKNLTWMDIAKVLTAAARCVNTLTQWSWKLSHPMSVQEAQAYAINAQRLENLKLDAQAKYQRAHKLSNEVTMTDARAELDREKLKAQILTLKLKNLELQSKLDAAGVLSPNFAADNYADPGDVRRGQMYESKDNNQFRPNGPQL